jgi:predicted metal-dependent hydrolase
VERNLAQLRLPFTAVDPTPAPGQLWIGMGASRFLVHLVRMRRAKRYIMRLRPDGALRVTIPRGGSRAEALRFAERHVSWAVRQRVRQAAVTSAPARWKDGTLVLLDGRPERLSVLATADGSLVTLGRFAVRVTAAADIRTCVMRAIRAAAACDLPAQLLALAAKHNLPVRRVTVRDQRSRWGSCSRTGTIALNYRLIQTPPDVRRYILIHELAHLVHPDHSRRFWTFVESLDARFRDSERWLKTSGPSLF